jgi:hypothetical protein
MPTESKMVKPTFLVFLNSKRITPTTSGNQPPFPKKVIKLKKGVKNPPWLTAKLCIDRKTDLSKLKNAEFNHCAIKVHLN